MAKRRRWAMISGGVVSVLVLAVAAGQWVPALTGGPVSSTEALRAMFSAPAQLARVGLDELRERYTVGSLEAFVIANRLPDDAEQRLLAMIRDDSLFDVDLPFVYHLYDVYGATAAVEDEDLVGLEYDDDVSVPATGEGEGGAMWFALARSTPKVQRWVRQALLLFDALFLQVKPGVPKDRPLHERYEPESYAQLKSTLRLAATDFLGQAEPAASVESASEDDGAGYVEQIRSQVEDEASLTALSEFVADFIRMQTESWLDAYARRSVRRKQRVAWVSDRIERKDFASIADWADAQRQRRLAVHVVVDGLQGRLLEGLVDLSSGRPDSKAAHYVANLVKHHSTPEMNPQTYGSKLPPGLGQDVRQLAEASPVWPDYLENFKRWVFDDGAQAARVSVATVDTPSISVRNLPIAIGGHAVAGPSGTGIPNFSYVDRRTGQGWYFWGSDVMYLRDIYANREGQVPEGVKREGEGARTLFQRLWHLNSVSHMALVDNGALEKMASEVGVAIGEFSRDYPEAALLARMRGRARVEVALNERRDWLIAHRDIRSSFWDALVSSSRDLDMFKAHARYLAEHDDEGLPDYLLWFNPWPDHFAHGEGPYSDAIIGRRGEYDRLDHFLGKLVDVYRNTKGPPDGDSYFERTLFGIVSDHGLIYTPKLVSLETHFVEPLAAEHGLKFQKLSVDEGALPAIRPRRGLVTAEGFDMVVGSTAGGSYILDLFDADARFGTPAWSRHPTYDELKTWRVKSGAQVNMVSAIHARLADVIDVALARERLDPSSGEALEDFVSAVRVIGPGRGEARITRRRGGDGEDTYSYEVMQGTDPLALLDSVRADLLPEGVTHRDARAALEHCISSGACSDADWQKALARTSRADVVRQYIQLYESERSGTINLFPLPHVGVNSSVPGRHAGETFGEKNGTQLYFGAGLDPRTLHTARNGSLPVTLFDYLSEDLARQIRATEGEDELDDAGFGFPSLWTDIAPRSSRDGAAD